MYFIKYFFSILISCIILFASCGRPLTNNGSDETSDKLPINVSSDNIERFMVAGTGQSSEYRNPKIDYHKAGNNLTVIEIDEPWEEGFNLGGISGLFKDHDGNLRMYYGLRGIERNEGKRGVAMAISKDKGNTWVKPALGNLNKNVLDHEASNLILIPFDKEAHESKYKIGARAIGYHAGLYVMAAGEGNKAIGFTSTDGIHWKKSGYIGKIRTDGSWNIFYDTLEEEWKIYGRIRGRNNWKNIIGYDVHNFEKNPNPTTRRGISLSRSKKFTDSPWKEVSVLAMDPQDYWEGWNKPDDMGMPTGITPDFYIGSIYEYFGQYIGFPPTFFMDRDRINPRREKRIVNSDSFDEIELNRRSDGPIFPILVLSRNGRNFDIPFKNTSAIDEKPYLRISKQKGTTQDPKKPEVGQLQTTRMVIVDNYIQIYFLHRLDSHYEKWGWLERSIERTTIKLDRFASVGTGQEWLSERVIVPENAEALVLNSSGDISVRLRDSQKAEGKIIPGFSYEHCIVPSTDSVNNPVKWENKSIKELRGQIIRIEALPNTSGRFYGFSFSD